MTNHQKNDDAAWVSLFSVPLRRIRPHFWTFSACFVATLIFYTCIHTIAAENPSWREAPSLIMADAALAGGFWLFASPILLEVAIMVFAALYRHEKRQQDLAEGREQGISQANAAWRAWYDRRLAAEANGEPFTEPPPDAIDNPPSNAPESSEATPT